MPATSILSMSRWGRPLDGAGAEVRLAAMGQSAMANSVVVGTEVAFISDRAAFDALEDDWNRLFLRAGRSTQYFQTFNWLWHWSNHYFSAAAKRWATTRLAIVTVRRHGELVLVWPLVMERTAGLDCLTWMGRPVTQYGDILVDPAADDSMELIRTSWDCILARLAPDIVRLRKVRDDAAIAPFLAQIGATESERQSAPYLDLESAPDFETYEQRYSAKARKNRRRQMRRLDERGRAHFSSDRGGAVARELARLALLLKLAWLKDRGLVSPALADHRMTGFFADVAECRIRDTGCRVSALTSAGEAAAIEIAFECKGRRLVHVIVYGLKFDKAGAGNLLVEESVRRAKAEGIETFDLLAPGDAYKLDWADGSVGVADYAVPVSWAGRAYTALYLGAVRKCLKTGLAAMPASLRRVVASGYRVVLAIV